MADKETSTQPEKGEGVPNYPPPDYITAAREHGIKLRQSGPVRRGPQPIQLPILEYLKKHRVVLASASPRRRGLLGQLGLTDIEVRPSTKPEDLSKDALGPFEYVAATARQKCLDVYSKLVSGEDEADKQQGGGDGKTDDDGKEKEDPAVVIAADTIIVTRDGRILEKPPSEAAHVRMLQHLRDTRVHKVLTAVCVVAPKRDASHPGYAMASHIEETRVYFARASDGLPDEVITAYVRTREGVDKAGGYGLQGLAGLVMIEKVEGCVDNVIGLPVRKTLQLCEKVVFKQDAEDESDVEYDDDE
jgi:MAF protein